MIVLSPGKGSKAESPCGFKPLAADHCCLILMFFAFFFFAGCTVQQHSLDADTDTFRNLPAKYQEKALDYESRGMLREAMQSWLIVQSFYPDDIETKDRIERLEKKSQAKADVHFQAGVNFYQKGLFADASREFLLTLAYEQDHEPALDYLKKSFFKPIFSTYVVQHGDTLKDIAEKVFHDPDKDFLIIAFNDIDSSMALTPGTTLQIPLLGDDFPWKEKSVEVMTRNNAVQLDLHRKKRKVPTTASPGTKPGETAETGSEKKNDEWSDLVKYRKAKEFLEHEEYLKSLQMLLSVDINFRDVRELIASTEVYLQQEADAHYRKGISFFLAEDLDQAIGEWQEVLRLSPNHLAAQKDLRNARRLQEKMKKY